MSGFEVGPGPIPGWVRSRFGQMGSTTRSKLERAGKANRDAERQQAREDARRRLIMGPTAYAVEWLTRTLAGGPMLATEVTAKAEADGVTPSALRTARESLGVRSVKGRGRGAPWSWELPA